LGRFLDDRPILARPPTLPERAARWLRRHRSPAWTSAAVMALVSCVLAVATWRVSQERAEMERQRDLVVERENLVRQHLYVSDLKIAMGATRSGDYLAEREGYEAHHAERDG
jgi:hypothetical protein